MCHPHLVHVLQGVFAAIRKGEYALSEQQVWLALFLIDDIRNQLLQYIPTDVLHSDNNEE